MKTTFLLTFLLSSLGYVAGQSTADESDEEFYSVVTGAADWDSCDLEYTETCPPTISIEEAACAAPLVVYGRVLQAVNGATRLDTVVEIQVEFRSNVFDDDRKTVQKWGAGLDNTIPPFNESGFFTTWVSGFNNTPTDLAPAGFGTTPCGTRSPRSQEELYFFLEALPENAGKQVEFADEDTLNVNFTLSTSILQTGHAPGTVDVFDLIELGAFTDDNVLEGNCRAVYCCYNPDCGGECDTLLESVKDSFTCQDTLSGSPKLAGLALATLSTLALAFVVYL